MEDEDHFPVDPDEVEAYTDYLIEVGILEEDGFDEDGEVTYTYNFERMKELDMSLYETLMKEITDSLMNLYENDLVKIEYDEDLQAHFSATEKGFKVFKKMGY